MFPPARDPVSAERAARRARQAAKEERKAAKIDAEARRMAATLGSDIRRVRVVETVSSTFADLDALCAAIGSRLSAGPGRMTLTPACDGAARVAASSVADGHCGGEAGFNRSMAAPPDGPDDDVVMPATD